MFTFIFCLPWLIIIAVFLVGVIVNLINGDHVFKPRYSSKHGRSNHNVQQESND